ncbi:putative DNA-binding transcriptional regulator YafY [Paenibacillus cellulosilyticus]|uniref:Putative DNA-binding transcriptional regulator YafY n=1 Tax=Paenibacillus cellulosilyticus TaxID=375489 RepID=A0A2V2YUF8_9BACL|nr:YafY family protein [Paenibacillus cellulosilyticus]PWW02897.1 putative DNA-binding transcriptional regulator YafY [Paenibacillus cellulosilyticus]QKS45809.1 YafY family transcriptional regulator [Paenibacillus cellulosilyticus]
MNKTDRMLAIVLELQRHGLRRAEDLAAVFETSVRTIYRDVQALSEAGVPLIGSPGQGYSLADTYFLPPVSFKAEESVALLLGLDYIEQQLDAGYHVQAAGARRKIEAILPDEVRRETMRVRAAMKMLAVGVTGSEEKERLTVLRQGILEERKIRFHYSKKIPEADGSRHSVREADPYGLVLIKDSWTLVAYDHMRQGLRHFRLSRMRDIEITNERFHRPDDFDLHAYRPSDTRDVIVRLLISSAIADQVLESPYYYIDSTEETENGVVITLRIRHELEVLGWIMSWGASVVVLQPDSLRERVRNNLIESLKHY